MKSQVVIPAVLQNQFTFNVNHTLNVVYQTLNELVSTAEALEKPLSLEEAGEEILRTRILGESSNYFYDSIITKNLQNVSDIFILIACEPTRLKYADKLVDLPTLQKLWATAKTSLCEIRFIVEVLTQKIAPMKLSYDNLSSLDLLSENDIAILNFLMNKLRFNPTEALNFYNTCPAYLPAYDPLRDGRVARTEMSPYHLLCNTIEVMVNVSKSYSTLYLSLTDNCASELTLIQYYLPPVELHFQQAILNAMKNDSQISIHLGCKRMRLQLSNTLFELEPIKRPLVRSLNKFRGTEFLETILRTRILANVTEIFLQKSPLGVIAQNELNSFKILSAEEINQTSLMIYDNCPNQSPFSYSFRPENLRHWQPMPPYNLVDIHTKILGLCNHFNALYFIDAIIKKSVFFFTDRFTLQKCLEQHKENEANPMHQLVARYIPAGVHHQEELINNFDPSFVFSVAVMSFTLALLFYVAYHNPYASKLAQYPRKMFSPRGTASNDNTKMRLSKGAVPISTLEVRRPPRNK